MILTFFQTASCTSFQILDIPSKKIQVEIFQTPTCFLLYADLLNIYIFFFLLVFTLALLLVLQNGRVVNMYKQIFIPDKTSDEAIYKKYLHGQLRQ